MNGMLVVETVVKIRRAYLFTPGDSWSCDASRDQPAVAQAWDAGRRNPTVAAEIDRFQKAAAARRGRRQRVLSAGRRTRQRSGSLPATGRDRALGGRTNDETAYPEPVGATSRRLRDLRR